MRKGIVDAMDFEEYLRRNGYYRAGEGILDHPFYLDRYVYPCFFSTGEGADDVGLIEKINYGGNIMTILTWEKMDFAELVEKIDLVRQEYEVGGRREKLGGSHHYAIVESLDVFSRFAEEMKKRADYKPYIRDRYPYEVCLNDPTITDYVCIVENSTRKNGFAGDECMRAEKIAKIATSRNCPITHLLYNEKIAMIVKRNVEVDYVEENYEVREGTALFDAIGSAICYFEEEQNNAPEKKLKPLFLLFSDNLDTASKKYTKEELCALIKKAQDKGWLFAWETWQWKNYKELTPYLTYIDYTDPNLPYLVNECAIF